MLKRSLLNCVIILRLIEKNIVYFWVGNIFFNQQNFCKTEPFKIKFSHKFHRAIFRVFSLKSQIGAKKSDSCSICKREKSIYFWFLGLYFFSIIANWYTFFAIFANGEMAEWSIAAVLKTVDCNRSGGSNPSLSATLI